MKRNIVHNFIKSTLENSSMSEKKRNYVDLSAFPDGLLLVSTLLTKRVTVTFNS